jgi:hypothetical protein
MAARHATRRISDHVRILLLTTLDVQKQQNAYKVANRDDHVSFLETPFRRRTAMQEN